MISRKFIISTVIVLGLVAAANCQAAAATLYMSPAAKNLTVGQKFTVTVYVNSGGQAINAVRATLSYSTEELSLLSIAQAGSIIRFWAPEPSFSATAGVISFGGGLPSPGYNGLAGKIVVLNFQAKKTGDARLAFTSGSVLANDGKGTNVLSGMSGGEYKITGKSDGQTTKETPPVSESVNAALSKPAITSPTHPDQTNWYSRNYLKFSWQLPPTIQGVSVLLDQASLSDPGSLVDGLFVGREYANMTDGIWFLHLKFEKNGRWSETDHYRVQIDTTPPKPFIVKTSLENFLTKPEISFSATDETSGLDHYEVSFDNQEFIKLEPAVNTYSPSGPIAGGEHFIVVKAVDRAGNETMATAQISVNKFDPPTFDRQSIEADSEGNLYLTGQSPEAEKLILSFQRQDRAEISTSTVPVYDGRFFVHYKDLPDGKYFFWAEGIRQDGAKSVASSRVAVSVAPSYAAKALYLFYGLTIILLLIVIILIVYIWRLKKANRGY